jgi:hypothetical protein
MIPDTDISLGGGDYLKKMFISLSLQNNAASF